MEKRVLLAFAGKMCTGKDTSANIWISRYCKYLNDINDVLHLKDLVGEELIFSSNMEIEIYDDWRE